jgi:CDP-diacylglycerol--serine O-phosphatidyltransferase
MSAKSFVNAANVATAGSLGAGFVAVILASRHEFAWAAAMVCLAVVLDVLDGVLARRFALCSPFGSQLDSLADVVSFGLAPALLLYLAVLESIPVAGVAASLMFLLAGAWRLARFHLIEEPYRFIGVPIPVAGVIAAGIAAWAPSAGLTLAITVVLSALMVSEIPFPTWRALVRLVRVRRAVEVEGATLVETGGRLLGRDHAADRLGATQRARARRKGDEREPEQDQDERVRAPTLAG